MKNKKNIIMIVVIVIFICLISVIPVYRLSHTSISVEKNGLKITSSSKKNKNNYVKDKNTIILSSQEKMSANNKEKKFIEFKIAGESEVASNVIFNITGNTIYLKQGKYRDMTTNDINVTFSLQEDYYPIIYTLTKNGEEIGKGNLNSIKNIFNKNEIIDKNKEVNDVYNLSWEWVSTNSKADNYLSKALDGAVVATSENYNITESFKIELKIEEVK